MTQTRFVFWLAIGWISFLLPCLGADAVTTSTQFVIYTFDGEPQGVTVTADRIFVDYMASRCEFDRTSGRMLGRRTRADGYAHRARQPMQPRLIGPGVAYGFSDDQITSETAEGARAEFASRVWRALQPAGFLLRRTRGSADDARANWPTWTALLNELNSESYVEAAAAGVAPRRYTMADGLASNLVTRFAAADDTLWAACADIYDPIKNEWGPGGLCRFNPKSDHWEKIEQINGRRVRWVTLLQPIDDELWVGFWDGRGIFGDKIVYSKGIYPGNYQPATEALVLARLKGGEWTSFARPPIAEQKKVYSDDQWTTPPSTERLEKLIVQHDQAFVLSKNKIHASGNWEPRMRGHLSCIDLKNGAWSVIKNGREIHADDVKDLIGIDGEAIAITNLGAFRLNESRQWQFLDPQSALKNPGISALAKLGDEVWVGYEWQSWIGGDQGLSRFNRRTGRWSWMSPQELGTSAPVLRIETLPDGSLWVLFGRKMAYMQMAEFLIYPPKSEVPHQPGLGRHLNGKWEFPAVLEGVTTSVTYTAPMNDGMTRSMTQALPIRQIAAAGGKLFVLNATGIYMGPDHWTKIHAIPPEPSGRYRSERDEPTLIIESDERGDALLVTDLGTPEAARDPHAYHQALYRPGDEQLDFKPVRLADDRYQIVMRGSVKKKDLRLETPSATWTTSYGELIRQDKTR